MISSSRITAQFGGKRTKWHWHVQGQKCTHMHATNTLDVQIFDPFALRYEPLSSYSPILKRCSEWPQNDLDMFHLKSIHMYTTKINSLRFYHPWYYIHHRVPNVCLFHPTMNHFWSYGPFFGKVHWMTSEWSWHDDGQKYQPYMHMCIHPRRPNFRPFHSTMSHFELRPNYEKSALKDPKMTLTCSGSKVPICVSPKWPWRV